MKITSTKKIKLEQYEVMFDNGNTVTLYEDVIVNNRLLDKDIDDFLYNQILAENEVSKLEYEAIKHIEKKIRSKKEMIDFLLKKEASSNTIDIIIFKLEELKLIDDKVFANSYAKDKYNISKCGINKIISGLEEHDIDQNLINNAIMFISDDDQLLRIKKIVDRYLLTNKKDSIVKLKNKIYNNLIEKGYPKELIYEVINNVDINTNEIIKKQYDILYKKYSTKYEGDQLVKKIISGLQVRGFSYEDIKKLEN